jgi:hypothetical protein
MRLVVGLMVFVLACKGGKDEAPAGPDPEALRAQQELLQRRDALIAARQKLQKERDAVDDQIHKAQETGGDTSELAKQRAELDSKIEGQASELITTLSSKIDAIPAAVPAGVGGKDGAIAAREAGVASREKDFSAREQRIADREKALADRERALAEREKTTCSGGGTMTIVQAPPLAKDANIGRADVEKMLTRAHAAIGRKNLIAADLGAAGNLESEANKAANEGNWSKAYFAAQQLALSVEAVKIDRNFINAKVNRLQARLGGQASAAQAQGMKDVLQKYGDGDFVSANRLLNAMWK